MNTQNVKCLYNRGLLGNKRGQTTNTSNHIDESPAHYAHWTKPDTKECKVQCITNSRNTKYSLVTESKSMLSGSWNWWEGMMLGLQRKLSGREKYSGSWWWWLLMGADTLNEPHLSHTNKLIKKNTVQFPQKEPDMLYDSLSMKWKNGQNQSMIVNSSSPGGQVHM